MLDLLYPLGAAAFVFGTYGLCVLIGRFRKKGHKEKATGTKSSEDGYKHRNYAKEWLEERGRPHGPNSIHDDLYK